MQVVFDVGNWNKNSAAPLPRQAFCSRHRPPSTEQRRRETELARIGGPATSTRLALVELQNGEAAPTHVAGTANFYAITRYNWSSYYAMAVIELGAAVRRAR